MANYSTLLPHTSTLYLNFPSSNKFTLSYDLMNSSGIMRAGNYMGKSIPLPTTALYALVHVIYNVNISYRMLQKKKKKNPLPFLLI